MASGAIAAKILKQLGIELCAYTRSIGPVSIDDTLFEKTAITETPTAMPDRNASRLAENYLADCMKNNDSAGGVIECRITGVPAGIGDPVFDKLDARLSAAVMSVGAVKAIEIGDGFAAAAVCGSANNDAFFADESGIRKKTNHAGGILGGISDGSEIVLRAFVKPTPSIFSPQESVTCTGENTTIQIKGRHDPVIVPRAVVVVECMCALTVLDLLISNMSSTMDGITGFYSK